MLSEYGKGSHWLFSVNITGIRVVQYHSDLVLKKTPIPEGNLPLNVTFYKKLFKSLKITYVYMYPQVFV
jgi:hypothetical protein